VNEGYAATGPPTLPYDYPYIEVNGGIVNSVSTFHPPSNQTKRSKKTSQRNSTNTLGYIEVNQNTQQSGYATLRQSNGSSIVEKSVGGNSNNNPCISMNAVIEEQSHSPVEDTNTLLSPPASSTTDQHNIQTNTNNNSGYITIHK